MLVRAYVRVCVRVCELTSVRARVILLELLYAFVPICPRSPSHSVGEMCRKPGLQLHTKEPGVLTQVAVNGHFSKAHSSSSEQTAHTERCLMTKHSIKTYMHYVIILDMLLYSICYYTRYVIILDMKFLRGLLKKNIDLRNRDLNLDMFIMEGTY